MPATPACSSGAEVLSAQAVCAGHTQRAGLIASEAGLFWLETDPSDGRARPRYCDGSNINALDQLQAGVGSRLNGYGGGSMAAVGQCLIVVTDDQQLLALATDSSRVDTLVAADGANWGGLVADPVHHRVLAVREHAGLQSLVAVYLDGHCECLHEGQDFYGAPAISEDGRQVAWVSWQLPDMPWHSSSLWVSEVTPDGRLGSARNVFPPSAGSIQQPVFSDNKLIVLSDHAGWWQPWSVSWPKAEAVWTALPGPDLDHANAPWQLGERHYCVMADGRRVTVRYNRGFGELWLVDAGGSSEARLADNFSDFRSLSVRQGRLYCIARSDRRLDAVIEVSPETGRVQVLAGGERPAGTIASPERFCIPAAGDCEFPVHGFLYQPTAQGPAPLILVAHGGPTSAAYPVYNAQVQFWCQRGYAVAEVNYRGSSGFGRAFRQSLAGNWGRFDVEDMERTARYLSRWSTIDGQCVYIQGRSSGGFTALMSLVNSDLFRGGASLFGVTDPLQLREQTHRFESGYLDWLLGNPARHKARWADRTPRFRAHAIRAPIAFFQGGQDKVVVPEQTQAMVTAIENAGGSPELHWFEEEGHGFRNRDNQARVLDALYDFYQRHRRCHS